MYGDKTLSVKDTRLFLLLLFFKLSSCLEEKEISGEQVIATEEGVNIAEGGARDQKAFGINTPVGK